MNLKELAQAVMLGTERGPALPSAAPAGGALAEVLERLGRTDDPVEARVLKVAAVLAPYEEAGRRTLDAGRRELPPECPPEELPVCSDAAATVLRRILTEQPSLLDEWLTLATARGVRVRPPVLPLLLEAGRRDHGLRPGLARVMGRRGLWLAARNEKWSYALAEAAAQRDEKDWLEGRLEVRKGYLRTLRGRDPRAGRERLEEVWNEENATTRANLLSTLEAGLGMDDEPFLENCLDDRSKLVRKAAVLLLGRLDDSRRARRMAERCARYVRLERKLLRKSLAVDLPEELDDAMQRDGLDEKSDRSDFGPGAARLFELVAATPTWFWSRELGFGLEALLKALRRHTWGKPVVAGLFRAAVHARDADLALALLGAEPDKDLVDEKELIRLLVALRRDEFLVRRLRDASDSDARGLLLLLGQVTGEGPIGWSDALAEAVLARYVRLMSRSAGRHDWQLHGFLATLAACLPVSMTEAASARLTSPAKPIPSLEDKLNDFTVVLDLRTRMHKELARE